MQNKIIDELKLISNSIVIQNIPVENCQDWRKNFIGKPLALIYPTSAKEISDIVKICNKYNVSIVTQGGNTSLCGASVTDDSQTQILLNLRNLNKIKKIDLNNNSITVEAGCTLEYVQEIALKHNLLYPLSLPSEKWCTIGGNLSTNAGGVSVLKYGNSRQLCLGIEAVLADGTIYNSLYNLYKNNMGYDLKQLFIGAEGTLGIITSASLRLYPLPKKYYALWIGIDNFEQALNLFKYLQKYYAHAISSFEIMNSDSIKCVQSVFIDKLSIINKSVDKYNWHILLELEEHGESIGNNLRQKLHKIAEYIIHIEEYSPHSHELNNINNISKLWEIRHAIPIAQKELGGNIKHDISLSLENIVDFINKMPEKVLKINVNAKFIIFGHIGDGNLHYNIVSDKKYEEKIQQCIYKEILSLNGSIAAEHGIGRLKTKLLKTSLSQSEYALSKLIKKSVDPKNIFNPHVIFS